MNGGEQYSSSRFGLLPESRFENTELLLNPKKTRMNILEKNNTKKIERVAFMAQGITFAFFVL